MLKRKGKIMDIKDFDYNLPEELIAQVPIQKRDESRLMVLDREKQTIEHKIFKDILEKADVEHFKLYNFRITKMLDNHKESSISTSSTQEQFELSIFMQSIKTVLKLRDGKFLKNYEEQRNKRLLYNFEDI